jgi:hypothetical protein
MKDRAITIFAIYLKLGNTCYVELDDFEDSPLILRPFETFQKEYGPVSYYGAGGNSRIILNGVFKDDKARKRLVLSTSLGKYTVPSDVPSWDPIFELFKNHMTALAQPVRLVHRDKAYGSNIKYLAEFESDNGDVEVVAIHSTDFERKRFKNFQLTREAMESKITLENFFRQQKEEGKLAGKSFKVHDLGAWRAEHYQLDEMQTIRWTDVGKFRYYVVGRVLTKLEDWRLKFENRSRAKRNRPHNRR